MTNTEKKKVTISLPADTTKMLTEISNKNGMTKSGLINYLINKVNNSGSIFE